MSEVGDVRAANVGPSARRLQTYQSPASRKLPNSSSLDPYDYLLETSNSRFFKSFRLHRRNSSSSKAACEVLSRSMINEAPSGSSVSSEGVKSRHYRSAGNIHLCDGTPVILSTILSDGFSKDNRSVLGKPRHLKRRCKGFGKGGAVMEPVSTPIFKDNCSTHDDDDETKQSSLVYSKSIDPCARVEEFALDGDGRSRRRARSASGSTTKLANFWAFLFNSGGGHFGRNRPAESVASSSGTTMKQVKSGALQTRIKQKNRTRKPLDLQILQSSLSHGELSGAQRNKEDASPREVNQKTKTHIQERPRSEGFRDPPTAGFPLINTSMLKSEAPINAASLKVKGPGLDSGISCRTATLRSRGSSAARSTAGLSGDSFGAIESYKKMDVLGEGSYATVYRGYSHLTNRVVAVKEIRINPEEGLPFTAIREASLLKSLRHANIVTLHDIVHAKLTLNFVFEYVDSDLSRLMEKNPNGLHSQNVQLLLYQLLRGLAYCHDRRILHRDLKPQNLLVAASGELKLADFGLARAKSVPSHTYSHEVVTLWYRPPDVLLGSTNYTASLDIWGVGCIFLEMLSGAATFPGSKDAIDQLDKIFTFMGTPTEETWPGVTKLPKYMTLLGDGNHPQRPSSQRKDGQRHRRPRLWHQGRPLHRVVPRLAHIQHATSLATGLLKLPPDERLTARAAMRHSYFTVSLPTAQLACLPDTMSIFSIAGLRMTSESPQIPTRMQHRDTTISTKVRSRANEYSDNANYSKKPVEITTLDDLPVGKIIPRIPHHTRGASVPVYNQFVAPPPPPGPTGPCPPLNAWPAFDWQAYHASYVQPHQQPQACSGDQKQQPGIYPTLAYCFPYAPSAATTGIPMCAIPANPQIMPTPQFFPFMAPYPFILNTSYAPQAEANLTPKTNMSPAVKCTYPPQPCYSACSDESVAIPSWHSDASSSAGTCPGRARSCSQNACSVRFNYPASSEVVWMVPFIPQSFYPGFPMQPPIHPCQQPQQPLHTINTNQHATRSSEDSQTVYTSAEETSKKSAIPDHSPTLETASATNTTTDSVTETSFCLGSLGGTPHQMFFTSSAMPGHSRRTSELPLKRFLDQHHNLQEQQLTDGSLNRSASFTTNDQLNFDSPQLRLPRSHAFYPGCWPPVTQLSGKDTQEKFAESNPHLNK